MIETIFPHIKKLLNRHAPQLEVALGRLLSLDVPCITVDAVYDDGDVTDRVWLVVDDGKLVIRGEDDRHRLESVAVKSYDLNDPKVFRRVARYLRDWAESGGGGLAGHGSSPLI